MTTLERAAMAAAKANEDELHWEGYLDVARAVLMAVLPKLQRYDSDVAGRYQDDRGDYVLYDDLSSILE